MSVWGRELIEQWAAIDRSLASWVLQLADFDASRQWAEDGASSCVGWLVHECGLGWTTAKDKMRLSHELRRRPVVRDAFADDRLSYTQAKVLVRLEGLDNERDERFVADAAALSARSLGVRVDHWNWVNTQDKKPTNLDDHYGMYRQRGFGGGMGRLIIEAPDDDLDRVLALTDALLDHQFHHPETPAPVDKVNSRPCPQGGYSTADPFEGIEESVEVAFVPPRSLQARRLDALLDLVETGAAASPDRVDPEKAAVGVTVSYETLMTGDGIAVTQYGTVLTGEAVRRLCCDAGIHRMITKGVSELLDIGRKTRTWPAAQRRAIRARHGFRCAIKGCGRRITQIHHLVWWENGGLTCVSNGVPLCSYHHHLVHEGGWKISWNSETGITRLEGPLGQRVDTESVFNHAA